MMNIPEISVRCIENCHFDGSLQYIEGNYYKLTYGGFDYGYIDERRNMVIGYVEDYDGTFVDDFWNKYFVII
jgi:hypothetical protein